MRIRGIICFTLLELNLAQPVESTSDQTTPIPAARNLSENSAPNDDSSDDLFGGDFDDHFMIEWESQMKNFNPDLLVTVPMAPRSDEFFYEDVTEPGGLIRGAYFVIGSEKEEDHTGVDFVVTDPDGAIVYERRDKSEGVFSHMTAKKGTYSIMIGNHKWMSGKQVTVLMGMGEHNALKPQDVTGVTEGFTRVEASLKEIQSESSYLWIRQKSHMKAVSTINSRVYWYFLFEFFILLAVSSVQIYYVRGLLSNRRLF